MLLALMYHRIGEGKHSNSLKIFREHLLFLKERYPTLLPGQPLTSRNLSLCLTFDDATYDFYHYVYPLLKTLGLRALIGVPTRYILDATTLDPETRLAVPYTLAMQDGIFEEKAPFCTWEELHEMVRSGHVEVASHSHSHANLTFDFVNLHQEIIASKKLIESKLPQTVSTFIYPFGKTNHRVHAQVSKHYPYAFRIGSALNFGWHGKKPLTRIPSDHLTDPRAPFTLKRRLKYLTKAFF